MASRDIYNFATLPDRGPLSLVGIVSSIRRLTNRRAQIEITDGINRVSLLAIDILINNICVGSKVRAITSAHHIPSYTNPSSMYEATISSIALYHPMNHHAVYMNSKDNKLYQAYLRANQVRHLANGKYQLPDGFYSAGFASRVGDVDVENLPLLNFNTLESKWMTRYNGNV